MKSFFFERQRHLLALVLALVVVALAFAPHTALAYKTWSEVADAMDELFDAGLKSIKDNATSQQILDKYVHSAE